MKRLPRTVIALGIVSLLTDVSSEMIYPLLPAFLAGLGASGAFIGLVDGVADTIAALLKLASGLWADRVQRRKPLVLIGYGLASVVRPLMALARAPWHVLAVRSTDRVGKGLRSSPRDALIAQATPADRRGVAFGFHRAMDNTGAFLGPLAAYALFHLAGLGERTIFGIASIPGVAALVVLAVMVREEPRSEVLPVAPAPVAAAPGGALPARFHAYIICLALFTLGNSTDFFLLLRAQDAGIPAEQAPLLWALLNGMKSLLSTPLSGLSDRVGRKRVIFAGWTVYALTYLGFAVAAAAWQVWMLFVVYAVYYAFTEGTEKALVADLAPPALRGRAFGIYNFTVGVMILPASLGFGWIWDRFGHGTAFIAGASLAGAAALALALVPTSARRSSA